MLKNNNLLQTKETSYINKALELMISFKSYQTNEKRKICEKILLKPRTFNILEMVSYHYLIVLKNEIILLRRNMQQIRLVMKI